MAAQCPNKSCNPFRALAAIVSNSESSTSSRATSEYHWHTVTLGRPVNVGVTVILH